MIFCSVFTENYSTQARTLFHSLREHNPTADFFVTIPGGASTGLLAKLAEEKIQVIPFSELHAPGFWPEIYTWFELCNAAKPYLLLHLLDRGKEKLTYVDTDMYCFESLDPLNELLKQNEILYTSHIGSHYQEASDQLTHAVLISGLLNAGFLSLKNTDRTRNFIRWWAKRTRFDSLNHRDGFFVDQLFLNFLPVSGLRSTDVASYGINIGHWNLSRFDFSLTPLRLFHFSGWSPKNPENISEHPHETPKDKTMWLKIAHEYKASLDKTIASGDFTNPPPPAPHLYARNAKRRALLRGKTAAGAFSYGKELLFVLKDFVGQLRRLWRRK